MSRNCHQRKKLTRRDDLETLMYIVIRMVNGYLPWSNLDVDDQNKDAVYLKAKESFWGKKLLEGLPPVFQEFVDIITTMELNAEPDYNKLISLMTQDEADIHEIKWNPHINPDKENCYYDKQNEELRGNLPRF
jgi:hypothetical protein